MELSNCSLVIVRILNDILLWIYICVAWMDQHMKLNLIFLFCFLLVFCLLLNDRHVKLLRNPSFRFMWSKSNKFLLNLYHKINPIAIFFHYEMRMMFTNRLNSRVPSFLSEWANSLSPRPVLTQGRIFTKYMTCISLV